MKISLSLFICLLHGITCLEPNLELAKYLDERAQIVDEKLIRHASHQRNVYTVKFDVTNNTKLIGNYSKGEIFTFFNAPYALMNRELYQISQNNYSVVHNFPIKDDIVLFKSSEFEDTGFLMLATKKILHIFGFSNETSKIFKIQNIIHPNVTDAAFFHLDNDFYLITSGKKSHDLSALVVYKFLWSHFDETQRVFTSSHSKLHTFHSNGSEIIMTFQKYSVSLYKFKHNQIKKIHKIDVENPEQAVDYLFMGKHYVIIFSQTNTVNLYLWTGTDLLFWEQLHPEVPLTGRKAVFYVNNNPYLFAKNNVTHIFSLVNNQFQLISSSKAGNWTYQFIDQKNVLVTLGLKQEAAEVAILSVSVQAELQGENIVEEDKLSDCFLNLEKAVYLLRNKLTDFENGTSKLREASGDNSQNELLFKKMDELEDKYSITTTFVDNLENNILVVNENAVLDIPSGSPKVIAKDLYFHQLNNQDWKPNKWLSYTTPQRISGPVKAHLIQTQNLRTNPNHPLYHDLLLSQGDQIWTGSLTVKNLKADRLEIKSVNGIPMQDFYYKSQPVTIEGLKSFPELRAKNVEAEEINGMFGTKTMAFFTNLDLMSYNFDRNITIENLFVENINGVNFENFKNAAFRIGHVDTIHGSLKFRNLRAKEMIFDTLSQKSNFLTTSTDQTINSKLTISKIFAKNIKSNRINGVDFKNSAVTSSDNFLDGPVSIKHINIRNNLQLQGNVDNELLLLNDTHIVGTNESDFLQRYNGKVKIKGNLILKNFDLGKSAKLVVADKEFDPKMDQFWTKTTQQKIPTHFEAKNGMSTSHLFANSINAINVRDYLLNSTEQKKTAKFYFDSVAIKGNVFLNPQEQHTPDFRKIQRDSVKNNGTFNIKGRKTYTNILQVDELETGEINSDAVNPDNTASNSRSQAIRNLIVRGNLNSDNLFVAELNSVQLKKLTENTVFIDKPQILRRLNFENVSASQLFVTTLNGNNAAALLDSINQTKINKIDRVYADDVDIKNVDGLLKINNQDVEQLLLANRLKFENNTIFETTKFLKNVKVRDLRVKMVNDVDLQDLSLRVLYKRWNQPIKKRFTISKLISNNLITDQINEHNVKNLIDVSSSKPQQLFASKLNMAEKVKIKNLDGTFECDLHRSLRNPLSRFWNSVVVTGNVTFWDKESLINRIFNNVVTQKKKQSIKAKVNFVNHISANNITALKLINDVDVVEIIQDAFLNRPDLEQVIKGKKTFVNLEAEELVSLQNTNVSQINEIKLMEVDEKIISKNSLLDVPIKGHKVFFGGLQTQKLEADVVSGVKVEDLVSFETDRKIPNAMFESVSVENNFNIQFINGMPFEVFLKERLLRQSPSQVVEGNYFFRNVKFTGDVSTPQINDIPLEKMVFDVGTQTIESPKKFSNLKIVGNVTTELINGLKISESYEKAVLRNEDTNFTGTVQILKPALVEGHIQAKYINSVPMEYMLDTSAKYSLESESQKIHEIIAIISNTVHKYLNTTINIPTEILYLEKSTDLQIPLPNVISAQVVETKDDILIHVETEEDGSLCDLPNTCNCPMQQTMQISSENSVSVFMNKAMQRIYNYYDDHVIVHLITQSVSSSSHCRTSKTKVLNEISTLTWNVPPKTNNTGGFFIHKGFFRGYVKSVEFFTIYGRTYIVVGISYDPVLDTHATNTVILRLTENKTAVEEIQRIPTQGMKTVSLIPTAQGVVLILGSDTDQFNNTHTQIFRFSIEKQQFERLREVPMFGSLFAAGVVLEIDSLIVLADKRSTLLVLKYHADFDNYYLYQSFQLNYPVSSMAVSYAKGFGISDAYLIVVTANNEYFIYSFWFIEGWKLEFSGELQGAKILIPFKMKERSYLFAPSDKGSSLLTLVEHDSN